MRAAGLKDTLARRSVVETLAARREPATPADIAAAALERQTPVNLVTVYRILEALEGAGVVHRHPCSGRFALCQLESPEGHHGFLHCHDCGRSEEFLSEDLCRLEKTIAASAGFASQSHVAEIIGTCRDCRS
jgi:Fe2+ or Zn2+ uptake regulation protein